MIHDCNLEFGFGNHELVQKRRILPVLKAKKEEEFIQDLDLPVLKPFFTYPVYKSEDGEIFPSEDKKCFLDYGMFTRIYSIGRKLTLTSSRFQDNKFKEHEIVSTELPDINGAEDVLSKIIFSHDFKFFVFASLREENGKAILSIYFIAFNKNPSSGTKSQNFSIEFDSYNSSLPEYSICLSLKNNFFAVMHEDAFHQGILNIFQINFDSDKEDFMMCDLVKVAIDVDYGAEYETFQLRFNDTEDKLLIRGDGYCIIYPINLSCEVQPERFDCWNSFLVYDRTLRKEFLFLNVDREWSFEIHDIQNSFIVANGIPKAVLDVKRLPNFEVRKRYLEKREMEGNCNRIFVHSYWQTRLFVWSLSHKEVLVCDPFRNTCICKLTCPSDASSISELGTSWSGQEVLIKYRTNDETYYNGIFNLQSVQMSSLLHLAALEVLYTYPVDVLKTMNIPRHLNEVLGLSD